MAEECANPLLLQWLKEWMDEAQERNSKGYTVYRKAYQSMKACPLKFDHPSEAQQLNGLGPKLCDRLAEKLKKHCAEHGLSMPEKTGPKKRKSGQGVTEEVEEPQPAKKPRKTQLYVPKLRSGAYALLMALAELDQQGAQAMTKTDLIAEAQPLCDSSFTAPSDPTKFYTAWKSMQILESKELVCTRGHPTKRYYLSDEGWEVVLRIKASQTADVQPTAKSKSRNTGRSGVAKPHTAAAVSVATSTVRRQDVIDLSPSPVPESLQRFPVPQMQNPDNSHASSTKLFQSAPAEDVGQIVLRPGTFEVQMILDSREIRTTTDRDYLSRELKKHDITPDIRALPLCDVLWIAKIKQPYDSGFRLSNSGDEDDGSTEIVLEHGVERKRLDDLIGSIKDGRFHEQKFRLRKSGMRNVTYLIEDYSLSAERSEKYGEAVESAIASMQIVNDIFVKQTSKIDHTIRYLARMTKTLKEVYEKKELHILPSRNLDVSTYLTSLETLRRKAPEKSFCITFSAFCSFCDKSDSMTLRDVYLKMLMCIRGVTGDKAIEIQKIWNTPQSLLEAYEAIGNDSKKKESMISDKLSNTIPRKKVAKALSAKIAEVWTGQA